MKATGSLVKLILFAVVTVLLTGVLAGTIGNISFGAKASYHARFLDATGLITGTTSGSPA